MTYDEAMAALATARMNLFNASQRREAVVLRHVRVEAPESLDTINNDIAAARDAVQAAVADVQLTLGV